MLFFDYFTFLTIIFNYIYNLGFDKIIKMIKKGELKHIEPEEFYDYPVMPA